MKNRYLLLSILMFLISGCYEDLGNYDYKNLQIVEIDTAGKNIKDNFVAYQFEVLSMPIGDLIKYDGEPTDLEYVWSMYPQSLGDLPESGKYDSAKIISTKPGLDMPIEALPGNYYLALRVKENVHQTEQFIRFQVKVESRMSSGLLMFYEDNGGADLAMLKSKLLMPDIDKDEVFTGIYSGINEDIPLSGARHIGLYTTNLYLFTDNGGVRLNGNTYAVNQKDYTQLFSFPRAIVRNPQAYSVSARPVELIINDGLVYALDRRSMGVTVFGDRLEASDGKSYYAAPFSVRFSATQGHATVIYDELNYSFRPLGQFASNVGVYTATTGAFDVTNIDRDLSLEYMGNGFNEYTYSVFKGSQGYKLYITDFSSDTKVAQPISLMDMPSNVDWSNVDNYLFASTGNFCYFSINGTLYVYNYNSSNADDVYTYTSGTITKMKIFEQTDNLLNNKVLLVATYDATSNTGTINLLPINEINGKVDTSKQQSFSIKGMIKDFIIK
ncbi:MAG: PKD-like family lipoprotein [Marinifilaceae bacterium]